MGKWRKEREGGSYFTAPFKESYGMPGRREGGRGLYVLQYNRMGGRVAARSLQGKAARFDRRFAPRKLFVSLLEVVLNASAT